MFNLVDFLHMIAIFRNLVFKTRLPTKEA